MYTIKKRLGELLLESGMITEAQLQTALEEQRRSRKKLGDVLLEQGVLTEHQLIEALEFQLGIPHATLARLETDPKLTEVVSEQMAKRHQVLPIRVDGRKLMVAMADPLDLFVIEDLRISTGFTIEPAIISRGELQRGIARLYGQQDSGHEGAGSSQIEVEDSMILDEDSPVVRLVQQMIEQAVRLGASDIHVDPMDAQLTVRYRVDGQLRKGRSIPKSMQSVITARLKILAHLNIEEHRLPQSGRIKLSVGGKPIDVRLSSLPTVHGEQIVMRLFDPSGGIQSLDKLGMTGENLELFRRMAGKRRGMILLAGPAGSGKTATLYSVLQHLNREETSVITLEDPVEYILDGVNQMQVYPAAGLTFAKGLRSILRQDPNVIMVGEIPDPETAEIAIRASLTGQLVLSALHTSDTVGAVVRLREMGIEPHLIASSLIGVVAQRLVRCVCPDCKTGYAPDMQELLYLERLGFKADKLYRGTGCAACGKSGYRGRMAVHEVLFVGDELRSGIASGQSAKELRRLARETGMTTLLADGIGKVLKGHTTLQEIIREAEEER
ncbi:MAG: ATPase, T2SS/T4P/T4SS family [Paenibacillus macerans]|uniref:GspE/PulE family protein n=1 Tax=Paenibacillus TaxID=44249 RepID=UPI000EBE3FEB|nr:GspE/PulE family protein [Paenibacillus macerans]MBS5913686.1 Flp pilus assembly complex ATPase component TadA [Paenibacillus macerans]MDU7477740.1 ATPase, T2SS/T4P/T4SS family [Paenibacillus macerans]GBK63664.1 type II secretion system protein E [Paenibacillus macerans]GBK69977.1 type II secretion system protein E [Paenibacillus macerans]GIP13371.1 type II secretion system protein E [Paenibacillus macerans]